MPAISSSVRACACRKESGSRARGVRVMRSSADSSVTVASVAWRSAAMSRAGDVRSAPASLSRNAISPSPSRRWRTSSRSASASAGDLRTSAASRNRSASACWTMRLGDGAIDRLTTTETPAGIATKSHAYSRPRVASSPGGRVPSRSSAYAAMSAMVLPIGRSLLADTRNSRPKEIAAMAATRQAATSTTTCATRKTKPITTVITSVFTTQSSTLSARSGLLTKNAT
jgi:hypothetical protein